MSTESLNKTPINTAESISNKNLAPNRVNIDVLKNRIYKQEKKEKFQARIAILAFCCILSVLGYVVSL